MRRAVLMMRQAISPRLAIKIRLNMKISERGDLASGWRRMAANVNSAFVSAQGQKSVRSLSYLIASRALRAAGLARTDGDGSATDIRAIAGGPTLNFGDSG